MAEVIAIDSFRHGAGRARRATENKPTADTPKKRKLSRRKIAVFDHAGVLLDYIEPEEAGRYLRDRGTTQLGTKRRIRAIRLGAGVTLELAKSAQAVGGCSRLGKLISCETWDNPAGVYSFDRIKSSLWPDFNRIIESVSVTPKPVRKPASTVAPAAEVVELPKAA